VLFVAGGTMATLLALKPEWFFDGGSEATITVTPVASGDQSGLMLSGSF
jgi:hypothetical protein